MPRGLAEALMPEIDNNRKDEIVEEYRQLLEDGTNEEQAAQQICEKYGVKRAELNKLVAEADDDDEDGREPA